MSSYCAKFMGDGGFLEFKLKGIVSSNSIETPVTHVKTGDSTNINHWITWTTVAGLSLIVFGKLKD